MPRWYVHLNGQQQGPFESIKVTSMLRLGTLKADDLVWHEGMENWTAAALVPELTGRAGNSVAPSATGLSAPAIAPVIGDDAGPFRRIAKQFRVLGRAWSGPVVVSPKAFYMMKVSRLGALHESGAAGALWAAAFETPDDTRTCGLADLPPHIRLQLDPKQKDVPRDVIVIKKEAVSLVKVPLINNSIAVHVGSDKVSVTTSLFGIGRVRRVLKEFDWTPNCPREPTEFPTYGRGFGRPADAPAPQGPSLIKRILYGVLALLLTALVLLLKYYWSFKNVP